MMQFMLLFSRQGKLRLQKWYVAHPDKLKKKITRELITTILARKPKMCSFLEWKDVKVVYKRYASLYFCCAIEQNDNELLTLEIIHRYVELLDKYFGSNTKSDPRKLWKGVNKLLGRLKDKNSDNQIMGSISDSVQNITNGFANQFDTGVMKIKHHCANKEFTVFETVKHVKLWAYADDLLLVASHHCLPTAQSMLQADFGRVCEWFHDMELIVNSEKTVCELDIIFNFEKAYFILDELLLGGEIQETSKKNVLKAIAAQDLQQEVNDGDTPYEL
ncbi:Belongs to the adaptor complexes small subunit [Homalodisca vitripennis]|nr:Belongs to the adaptor complexes small subunit [Homalodisca vitripennis]